jgi:hypothetical protein
MGIRVLLVAATALFFTFGCSPKTATSVRPPASNPRAFVRWIPPERAAQDAIAGIDAPATAELVALFQDTVRTDLGADDVSHLQIKFRAISSEGLSGILRGYSNESAFALFLLPYQSSPADWAAVSSITSGPHVLLRRDRVNVLASQIQQWLAGHGARNAVAEDVQLEVREGKMRFVMRGAIRGDDPNNSTSIAVTCLEGCPK